MGKQRSSMRQVPWQSWEHWKWVATELFSDSPERVSAALDRITAWQSRGKVPIAVETSAALIGIHQKDPQVNHGLAPDSAFPEELLRMMYAMAIQRLVNGVVDQLKKRSTTSVADRAEFAGLPRLLVDIRHEAAHTELPGLPLLQVASKQALEWLKLQYWDQQREKLVNARIELKAKLVEHCLLLVEILSPIAASADHQQSVDKEESDEESEELPEVVPQETMRVKKHQRSGLFNELLDLSLSSTSDLISILVHDGLLERGTPPSLNNEDREQPFTMDSMDIPDLASVTDSAWKFTLRELFFHLPRLPGMMLVAIVKHINKSCSQSAEGCSTDEPSLTPSRASDHTVGETTEAVPVDSVARNRLTSWCAWLLGEGSSQDTNHSNGMEQLRSKLIKLSNSLTVKTDLSNELLAELLRMCFRPSSGRGPLVELVSLIAVQLGGDRFQHRATALAQLGASMQKTAWDTMNRPEDQEADVRIAVEGDQEGLLKEAATPSPTDGDHTAYGSKSEVDSAFEIARCQQRAFLDRLSSQKNDASTSNILCGREPSIESTGRLLNSAASPLTVSPLKHRDSSHSMKRGPRQEVPEVKRWTVAENWRPCAIGMIPSPCHLIGIMPSLDMVDHGRELVISKQSANAGIEEKSATDTAIEVTDKNRLAAADTAEPMGKRRNDEHLDAVSGKKLKRTGCHVQFQDTGPLDMDEKDLTVHRKSLKGPSSPVKARSPQKEHTHWGSSMQGCLRQHGMFMPVTPQQLESLQSAIHIL